MPFRGSHYGKMNPASKAKSIYSKFISSLITAKNTYFKLNPAYRDNLYL